MLTFAYACPVKYGNPMGNRISKTVTDMTGKKAPFATYYTRDAQGNTMAVYDNSSLKSDLAICELDRPYLEKISRNIITYKAKSLIAEEDDFYQNSINEYISQNWQGDSCKYKYMSLISEKNIPCFIEQEDYNIIEQLYYQDFGYFQSVETSARKSYLSQKYNEHYENMGERTYCFIQELSIAMEQPIDAFEAWLMHQKRTDLRSKLDEFYTELAQTSIYYGILNDTSYQDSLYWKEQHLYGSSRLGIAKPELEVTNYTPSNFSLLTSNFKNYELTNHLGNILATIKDEKQQIDQNADGIVDYYEPIVITANDYYPFGMLMPNRSFSLGGSNYRFGFNGHEKDNEVSGEGNHLAFGDYGLDTRLGRRWNIEPHIKKYPFNSSYLVFGNNPILYADPDGKDIIVLRNSAGANGTGHGAILVGDNKNGWTYISKDGFTGSAFGSKSKFVVMKFSSIEEFRNSVHNFETNETHSTADGKEAKGLTYKLDDNGNKVQRYDQALYFPTTQADGSSTDQKTIDAATKSAQSDYCLMNGDCSDVVGDGLAVSKDNNGKQIKNGNNLTLGSVLKNLWDKMPNSKYNKIKSRNESDVKYDEGVKPDDNKLKTGETGTK